MTDLEVNESQREEQREGKEEGRDNPVFIGLRNGGGEELKDVS